MSVFERLLRGVRGGAGATRPETTAADLHEQASAHFTRGDYEAALAVWLPLAQAGLPAAQNNVGMCLIGGLGVEPDLEAGGKWLRAAAHGGDPAGQRNLGHAYLKGEGAPQSDVDALMWYRRAAEQGDADAQDMLSWMLSEDAPGRPPDYAEALRWAHAAAEQGVAGAMTRIGLIHHNALGVERCSATAVTWWRKAALLGDADAQAMLGAAYHIGQGVDRDPVRAYAWLRRARWGRSKLSENFIYAVRASLSPQEIALAEALSESPDLEASP